MTKNEKTLLLQIEKITKERDLLREKCQQSEEAYALLLFQLKEMMRHRFGQRSERYEDPDNPQGLLFEENSQVRDSSDEESDDDTVTSIAAYKRRKKANGLFAENLPRKEIIIPVEEHHRQCKCGCRKRDINHIRHERLNYQPPVYEVIVELREVVACPKGCEGEMVTAAKPKHILPKAKFTESLLAHLIVSKLDDRQPYYHLEKQFEKRAGFTLSRQTMARATIQCSEPLRPLIDLMKKQVMDYDIGALDATSLQVLREPGRPATRKSYAYCMRGGPPGKEVVLYEYNATDHKRFVDEWFADFSGKLHCDGDPFFDLMFERKDVQASYCNTHARRKFEPVAKASKGNGLATQAMRFYKRIYRIEQQVKNNKMNPDQRYALRLEKTRPIMEEYRQWLDDNYPTVLPKSPLGKAMAYCLKYWDGLCSFLEDGRLGAPLDKTPAVTADQRRV